ncbi:MAG TPA: ATPase, partial [Caulobacteraceae bacterium]
WWESSHSWFGDARRMTIEPRAGGCFCETGAEGAAARHATVFLFIPRDRLVLRGPLGPLQGMGVEGALTVNLADAAAGATTVEMTYAVGGWAPGGLAGLAGPVDGVLGHQFDRLKAFVESGTAAP